MSGYADRAFRAGCTPRQIEVLTLLEAGCSLRASAHILNLDFSTVRDHRDAAIIRIQAWENQLADEEGNAA